MEPIVRVVVSFAVLLRFVGLQSLFAQDTIYVPSPNRVAIRHLPSVPPVDMVPSIHVHTVVGTIGAVSLGEFDSGSVAPLHHHTREQVDVGLSGRFDMTIGSNNESLDPGDGVILPSNVSHLIANSRSGVATLVEFHTVRRLDMVPPRPKATYPAAAEPVPVPRGRSLVSRIDSGDAGVLTGETCTLRWRRVTAPVDVHPQSSGTELYLYVARGSAKLVVSGQTSSLSSGDVVIVPGATRNVVVSAAGVGDASIVEFSVRAP